MKCKDYEELYARDFANRQRAMCACFLALLACSICFFRNELLPAGGAAVGGFSLICASVAMVLAFGLAAAWLCERSHCLAVAGEIERGKPAANFPGPEFIVSRTGSTPVWGNGQTSCASVTELRGYNMDVEQQLKIAQVAREVARTD